MGHEATVSKVSADQLFYLRARGIPLAQARVLLTLAFLREVLAATQKMLDRVLFCAFCEDRGLAAKSRNTLLGDCVEQGALLMPAHFAPQHQEVVRC